MTYRNIDTQIWRDEWFGELDADEKLLFIYLFSNDSTFLTGLYKISRRVIAFETGLDLDHIDSALKKFQDDGKVYYQDGVMWVVNLQQYNASKSPKVAARIQYELSKIPDCPLKIAYLRSNNMVSIPYQYPTDTSSTLTLTESLTDTVSESGEKPAAISFYQIPDDVYLERIFGEVTDLITFPSSSRANDLERLYKIYAVKREETAEYLRKFWKEWIGRNYSKVNTSWLDWAVAGQIPQRKTKAEKPYIPEEHASEVY